MDHLYGLEELQEPWALALVHAARVTHGRALFLGPTVIVEVPTPRRDITLTLTPDGARELAGQLLEMAVQSRAAFDAAVTASDVPE